MKKFHGIIYVLLLAALILPMSGCGGGSSGGGSNDGGNNDGGSNSQADKLMVVTSSLLTKGGSYKLYRGDKVKAAFPDANANPKYYAAPVSGSGSVTLNLEFADALGDDQPFMITSGDNVIFYYNPSGNGTDNTTAYGSVIRNGGSTQQLSYSGLKISGTSGSSVMPAIINDFELEEVEISLNSETESATVDGQSVPFFNYAWHADPDHRDEYFTQELNGTEELTESEMMQNITAVKGVYVNRDIRYMPNTISFTGTAKNDEETEYAAYYSDSVQAEVAAELGEGYEGPYIFATLPQSAGQGGPGGGGGPQDGQFPQIDGRIPHAAVQGAVSNSDVAAFSTMTHSPEDAYENPVLHITETGLYRLKGTWHGQIWVDVDDESQVVLLLDNLTVSCDVAPALVFYNAHECGPDDSSTVSSTWKTLGSEVTEDAGAIVVLAEGSVNNFTGANVYRMLKPAKKKDSVTTIDGTDVSQQKKRYKMDAAFYSFVSMAIGTESATNPGTLNVTSTTYEGLDTEMHLTIDSGIVNVTAEDDGINVNEDDVSVFTLDGGKLTVIAKYGDGIDSNGYIVLNNGTLDVTAAQDSDQLNAGAEGPLDADVDVYKSDSVTYTHRAYSGNSGEQPGDNPGDNPGSGDDDNSGDDSSSTKTPFTVNDSTGNTAISVRYSNAVNDTDTSDRGIAETGSVFTLTHTVNDFSGVK